MNSEEQSVKKVYEWLSAANLESFPDLLHPDVDWITTPPDGRTRGREQVCAMFARTLAEWNMDFQPTSILTGEDGRITAQIRCTIRKKDGAVHPVQELEMAHLLTMQDGLIRKVDLVQCTDAA